MKNINYKTNWDLSIFYESLKDENLKNDIENILPKVDDFKNKYKGKIKTFNINNTRQILEYLNDDDKLSKHIEKTGYYLHFLSALDTQNQDIIRATGELDNLMTQVSNKLLFISSEFKELGFQTLIEFSNNKELKNYKNYFFQKANNIKYLLSQKEELALNLKENSGASAFNNLYEELTNSFLFPIKIDGEKKEVTDSEIRTFRMDNNPQIRLLSLNAFRSVYGDKKVQITIGNTYNSIVKDWTSEIKLRGYKSPLTIRNISEELDDEVVEMLLEEVKNAYPIYQKFLKLKARLLNVEKIKFVDLYAPIETKEKTIEFEEGLNIFLETIKNFDEEFYNYSKEMFEQGRVDVFPSKGKRGGAFAAYTQGIESFVLLNYTNKLEDVSILAHELGHAMHGHLSQSQKSEVFMSPLSLAETASIFNEMILSETLVKKLSNEEKIGFLVKKLEDIFATIFRQVQYVSFEKRVHETILSGKELTYEDFNKIWREEQLKMSGDKIEYDIPAEQETGWSTIPHIFKTPFYCYSYAFGNLLTFALYEKYKEEGKSFIEKYKNILKAGGSRIPYELLKENGFDIKSKEYYKKGLSVVEEMVNELETLV